MAASRRTLVADPEAGYASSSDVLPGLVVSTVGYSLTSPPVSPSGRPEAATTLHRGLPSPYLTFILALDAPIVSGPDPGLALGPGADRNEVLVAGLHSTPTYVVQPQTQVGIQLAVHPLAARRVFGAPTAAVPGRVTEGVDLMGAEIARVQERLRELDGWPARFALLADYLRRRHDLSRPAPVRPELVQAWSWLVRSRGQGSVDALARHVYLSPRQLRSLFQRELGIGPKQAARLMRFDLTRQRLARQVAAGVPVNLSELAQRGGYADHPHLTAEFGRFAGVSPSGWVEEERRNIQAGGHQRDAE